MLRIRYEKSKKRAFFIQTFLPRVCGRYEDRTKLIRRKRNALAITKSIIEKIEKVLNFCSN
jgi:hypothetical protein